MPSSHPIVSENADDDVIISSSPTTTPSLEDTTTTAISTTSKKSERQEVSMFSIGSAVWVLMLVELAERIAYYGTAFTLTTYCVDMLRINLQTTNIIVNLLYVVSPVAAVISGALSDTYFQRKKVLAIGGSIYALGLCLVATSGSPFMMPDFPNGSAYGSWGPILVVLGTLMFGCGYGTMKVCIAPLLADTALVGWGKNGRCCGSKNTITATKTDGPSGVSTSGGSTKSQPREDDDGCKCGCQDGGYPCRCNVPGRHLRESIAGLGVTSLAISGVTSDGGTVASLRASTKLLDHHHNGPHHTTKQQPHYGGNYLSNATTMDTAKSLEDFNSNSPHQQHVIDDDGTDGDDDDVDDEEDADEDAVRAEEVGCLLSKLFRIDYWVINFGSMIGIGATPFIRALDGRTRTPKPGDTDQDLVHAGYYIGYWACAVVTALAVVLFLAKMKDFASNRPGDAPGLFHTLYLALRNGCPCIGRLCSSKSGGYSGGSSQDGGITVQQVSNPSSSSTASNSGDIVSSTCGDVAPATRRSVRLRLMQHSHRCTATEDDRLLAAMSGSTGAPTKIRITATSSPSSSPTSPSSPSSSKSTAGVLYLQAVPKSVAMCYQRHFNPPPSSQASSSPPPTCPACISIVHEAFLKFKQEEREEYTRVIKRRCVDGGGVVLSEESICIEAGILSDWAGPKFLQYCLLDWFVAKHLDTAPGASTTTESPNEDDECGEPSSTPLSSTSSSLRVVPPGGARAISTTIAVCSIFVALPIYWLLAIQFSTNVVMQADWMSIPAPSVLPPEVFNNVNTLTILVSIPVFEYAFKRVYGPKKRPPVAGRIVAGFILMLIAMSMIAFIQAVIVSRGAFVVDSSSSGDGNSTTFQDDADEPQISYVLNPGQEYISAVWLIIPYFIQGLASVLVDTTCIEAAYTSAPENMKGSVMALYLLASSVSGFLGLIYAPFITPQTMLEVMISFAVLQGVVTMVFILVTTSASVGGCCRAFVGTLCCKKQAYQGTATIHPTGYSDLEGGHNHTNNTTNASSSSVAAGEASPFLVGDGARGPHQPKGKVLLEKVVLAKGNEE